MNNKIENELSRYRGKFFSGQWPTIYQMFSITASRFPDHPCFTAFNPERESYSFSQADTLIRKLASRLIASGVNPGDKVALNGKNSIQWAVGYLAINYAGAVVVPVDNQLRIERFEALSRFADTVFLIADADVVTKVDRDTDWYKGLKGVVTLTGSLEGIPGVFSDWNGEIFQPRSVDENALAAILFTSGTTGNEKGAMLTNRNIVSDVYTTSADMPADETDTTYALLPLHHSYTCTTVMLEAIKFGAQCIFAHGIIVSKMLHDLKRGKVTIFMGIPLLYNKLLSAVMKEVRSKGVITYALVRTIMKINGFFKRHFNLNPFRGFFNRQILSKIGMDHNKFLICGAGPLSPKVFRAYQEMGLDFLQGYGLTEASPVLTLNPIDRFKVNSIGKALPMMDIIIADPDEEGIGEIRVKGPNITSGYYKDRENTEKLFDENGYMKTGDLASVDKDGYFILRGRAKNLIVTEGGKNVYPEEIEDAFQTYDNIEQIMVRGFQQKPDVPSEAIEALIYPNQQYYKDKGFDDAKIREDIENCVRTVNKTLLGYKKIEKITILDKPMDMTTTQKIKRGSVKV